MQLTAFPLSHPSIHSRMLPERCVLSPADTCIHFQPWLPVAEPTCSRTTSASKTCALGLFLKKNKVEICRLCEGLLMSTIRCSYSAVWELHCEFTIETGCCCFSLSQTSSNRKRRHMQMPVTSSWTPSWAHWCLTLWCFPLPESLWTGPPSPGIYSGMPVHSIASGMQLR